MKLDLNYRETDWWFWAVIALGIWVGVLGVPWGYPAALAVSVLNLLYYIARDGSIASFEVQIREVWLFFVAVAYFVAGMGWLFYLLAFGMVMVVFFNHCTIALVLSKMPWNQGAPGLRSH